MIVELSTCMCPSWVSAVSSTKPCFHSHRYKQLSKNAQNIRNPCDISKACPFQILSEDSFHNIALKSLLSSFVISATSYFKNSLFVIPMQWDCLENLTNTDLHYSSYFVYLSSWTSISRTQLRVSVPNRGQRGKYKPTATPQSRTEKMNCLRDSPKNILSV